MNWIIALKCVFFVTLTVLIKLSEILMLITTSKISLIFQVLGIEFSIRVLTIFSDWYASLSPFPIIPSHGIINVTHMIGKTVHRRRGESFSRIRNKRPQSLFNEKWGRRFC